MNKHSHVIGIEIIPKLVGVLFTERVEDTLRVFCYYTNGNTSQFDMPAAENLENLRTLFSGLNLDPNCTSLILDEVVHCRVFLEKNNQHWLYTLLKSPANTPPPMNADIAELPWQVVWRSQEAELLQNGEPGDFGHCFAIRTPISESDVARLIKNSRAFTNPVSNPGKKPRRGLYWKIALALVAIGLVVFPAVYASKHGGQDATPSATEPATVESQSQPLSRADSCYLLYQHQIRGPYPAKVIADMNAGGLLNAETLCRPENSADWKKLSELPLPKPQK